MKILFSLLLRGIINLPDGTVMTRNAARNIEFK